MAYDLHIERKGDSPDSAPPQILLADWRDAVATTEGVRLFAGKTHTTTNLKTGEVISISAREGDAEVYFSNGAEWRSVFRWRGDSVVFSGRVHPGDTSHPIWAAAVALATRLGVVIRGDEGEIYDLQTGKIVDA